MAIDAVYDPNNEEKEMNTVEGQLVSWVINQVETWEDHRDTNYKKRWDEYYRIWRGVYSDQDRTRQDERSRLISPATSQAIEVAAAEIEEAIFGKGKWFDISDDVNDDDKADMMVFRNQLLEDLTESGYPKAISEIILNSAIYGTGIGKVSVEINQELEFQAMPAQEYEQFAELSSMVVEKVRTKLTPVEPREFVIDPTATTIEDALGMAHVLTVPRHMVTAQIQSGEYNNVELGNFVDDLDFSTRGETRGSVRDEVRITEYHGLVPERLLLPPDNDNVFETIADASTFDQDEIMVEAIITIANDGELLKAVENPQVMRDRAFVAYQFDTVPNRFWGRGIAEKGYNPQKALDAELRGRIDAMSLTIHPMIGIDATRVPRGGDFSVRAGKSILTNGDPREVLHPFNFGQVNPATFNESGDLERMIQMATGAMDSATPTAQNGRNNTLGGMSIMQAGAIKRSKRTLANIEATFLKPLVRKSAWRLMQFSPETYPPTDPKFIVNSTLGIMARELEMQQLSSLLSTTQGNTTAYWMIMLSMYELSSAPNREALKATAQQMLEKSMQPQEDPQAASKQAELEYKQQYDQAKLQIESSRAQTEAKRVEVEIRKMDGQIENTAAATNAMANKDEAVRRSTIVETEKQVTASKQKDREIDIKEAELALKTKELNVKVTLAQNEILAEKDTHEREMQVKKMEIAQKAKDAAEKETKESNKEKAPTININSAGKKRIEVVRTANGLSGTSEEIN